MTFNPMGFITNLSYMGLGMLAIFVVIAIIIGITYLLNFVFSQPVIPRKVQDSENGNNNSN